MYPRGIVIAEGMRYTACSSDGLIQCGEEILIVRDDNCGLVVVRANLIESY